MSVCPTRCLCLALSDYPDDPLGKAHQSCEAPGPVLVAFHEAPEMVGDPSSHILVSVVLEGRALEHSSGICGLLPGGEDMAANAFPSDTTGLS